MATLVLDDIDETLLRKLKRRAQAHALTLESEITQVLSQAVKDDTYDDKWDAVRRIAQMMPQDVEQTDSTILIRQERDRR